MHFEDRISKHSIIYYKKKCKEEIRKAKRIWSAKNVHNKKCMWNMVNSLRKALSTNPEKADINANSLKDYLTSIFQSPEQAVSDIDIDDVNNNEKEPEYGMSLATSTDPTHRPWCCCFRWREVVCAVQNYVAPGTLSTRH